MNKYKCCLGLAILATLVTTPAQAESVSRKAADLMAQNSNSINSIKLPDLQVTNLATTTTPLYTGKEFYLTYKVENKGLTGATGSWTDKVYLSSDNRLDSNDNLIAENTFTPDTPFNSSYERNIPFLTPSTAGQYYLITIIDANNTLNEGKGLREENNSVFIPITVISANTPPSSSAVSEPSYPSSDTDSKLPASNYFYLGASVGRGFPSDIKLKAKATDAATIQSLRNNDIPNEFRNDFSLYPGSYWNIAGGYQWKDARAELEIGSGSFGNDELKLLEFRQALTGKINLTTVFVNGYYDIPTKSKFRPYLGAGIGLGFISDQDNGLNGVDYGTSFAYQGKVGLQYEIVKKGNAFIEFRYVGLTGYTSSKSGIETEIGSINYPAVSVGYRQGL